MNIKYHSNFIKSYKKRIAPNKKLVKKLEIKLELLIDDPLNRTLRNHKLTGIMNSYWSFSVTGDIRVIYKVINNQTIRLYDVGSHNQVY